MKGSGTTYFRDLCIASTFPFLFLSMCRRLIVLHKETVDKMVRLFETDRAADSLLSSSLLNCSSPFRKLSGMSLKASTAAVEISYRSLR